jgi:hypothetical protein
MLQENENEELKTEARGADTLSALYYPITFHALVLRGEGVTDDPSNEPSWG